MKTSLLFAAALAVLPITSQSLGAQIAQRAAVTTTAKDPGTSYRFRVTYKDRTRTLALLRGFDVLGGCAVDAHPARGSLDVIVLPEELAAFRSLGLASRLIDRGRPYAEIAKAPGPQGPDPRYYTPAELAAELLALQKQYPLLAKRVDLNLFTKTAATHEKRRIYALVISDNVSKDEGEPAALIAAQHHARELNSAYMVLQAAKRILAGYKSDSVLKSAVDNYELWLVPTMNPDGLNYVWTKDNYWRKNRRNNGSSFGVDQNRNYPFHWGKCGSTSSTPSSQVYRGPSAASEPETQTMLALAKAKAFDKYLDFHSYGREVLTTYNPCQHRAYSGRPVLSVQNYYLTRLRNAMSYRTRTPSASGEAPEFHWAVGGSLSFLVEVGTSFQPSFTTTVAEEKRVWPGVREFLSWRPSLSGHIRSLKGNSPLAATLDPSSVLRMNQGERSKSAASSGRYHLWLPAGAQKIPVTAVGHGAGTLSATIGAQGSSQTLDLILIPTLPTATLSVPALHKMGTASSLVFRANDPGRPYWIPMSLGTQPGLPLGPRTLPLNPDALFQLSAQSLGPIYVGQVGVLDAQGTAKASFVFPRVPTFVGFKLWFAGLSFEPGYPSGVKTWSQAHAMQFKL